MSAAPAEPFDAREAGRVVAGVLLAGGAPVPPERLHAANHGLARLALAPLAERDFVVSSPEELAPIVPPGLRHALLELLLQLAASDAMGRRQALTYAGLWNLRAPGESHEPKTRSLGERLGRAVIGQMPRHQDGAAVPEDALHEEKSNVHAVAYRSGREELAPVVDPLRARVARVRAEMHQVIAAVDRVVIGKHDAVARVLGALAARGHVLLVDTPGVGKTLLCKAIAAAIGARFGRIQLTPDLMPMDVTGTTVYEAKTGTFTFRPGPVFTNFLLADEINRATPKTQSALLEVMEERTVTVDGTTHRMADPFQVLATMNPLDHDGTFALPAAQIDRFMIMLELGHPSIDEEVRVLDTHLAGAITNETLPQAITVDAFVEWQRTVPLVHVAPEVKRAAAVYADGLRKMAPNGHTVSPRATLAWLRASQARAILAGREFVTLEDLADTAPAILRHRLWMSAPEVRDRLQAIHAHAMGAR